MKEIEVRIPEGMDPNVARMLFTQYLNELHSLEPLMPREALQKVAEGLINDSVGIQMVRKRLLDAPIGAQWAIDITEPPRIVGGQAAGFALNARARLKEATDLNESIMTLTCIALLTSPVARGLAALNGIRLRIRPPTDTGAASESSFDEPDPLRGKMGGGLDS